MGIEIPKKALALAKSVGIDLKPIVDWAMSVEARFKLIETEMPQKVANELVKIAEQRRQEQIKQIQQNPQMAQGPGGRGDLVGLLLQGLAGGGGGMSSTDKYFMRVGMDTVGLGHELYKSFIKEMVPQVIERWNKRKRELKLEPEG